ncbi:MAG: hypothetical protein V1929_05445 [bacterium]
MDWSLVNRSALAAGVTAVLIGFSTGCDWTSGGGVDDSNSSSINVSVAGVYRAADGGLIVSGAGSETVTEPTPGSTNTVNSEVIAQGNGSATVFAATLDHGDVVSGSLTITSPGFSFTDADGDGTLTGSPSGSGTINYGTGSVTLDYAGTAPDAGVNILASYKFATEGTEGSSTERTQGSSAGKIYTFTIEQSGNKIRITDNLGDTYEGSLGSSQVTSEEITSDTTAQIQEVIQVTAEGVSGGAKVRIVGAFNVSETVFFAETVTADYFTLDIQFKELFRTRSLSMDGTWIEENGRTGDIRAIGPQNERFEVAESSIY